ncbi:MAG: hypothetical protein CME70_20150 [Halobacteriovorax sp.]|nr:hypothetical protein [Halobacteriovorax sp.]
MKTRLRLEGIYCPETITHLEERRIQDLGFDFRPKSLNFLQHYKFLEILESNYCANKNYWLHFDNEHPDLIKKLIVDSKEVLAKHGATAECLSLEFSDSKDAAYYDQFDSKFAWNFTDMEALKKVIQAKNLSVLILPFTEIEHLQNTSKFHEFVASFHKTTFESLHKNKIKLALKADWDSNLFPSLFEFIKFDFCSVPVNKKVEKSFRQIDYGKFDKNLDFYQNLDF